MLTLTLSVAALVAAPGCSDPLLDDKENRSQYDRYDTIRAQRADSYDFDAFGQRKPNLYGRLLGKE